MIYEQYTGRYPEMPWWLFTINSVLNKIIVNINVIQIMKTTGTTTKDKKDYGALPLILFVIGIVAATIILKYVLKYFQQGRPQ